MAAFEDTDDYEDMVHTLSKYFSSTMSTYTEIIDDICHKISTNIYELPRWNTLKLYVENRAFPKGALLKLMRNEANLDIKSEKHAYEWLDQLITDVYNSCVAKNE